MHDQKLSVLVLCTGNSCRSQMAESYLRLYAGDRVEVSSAGTEPTESVHPLTVRVMAEEGVDLRGRRPADYRPFLEAERIDYLIAVCDGAATSCPASWPAVRNRLSWPFDDPAAVTGTEDEALREFRRVRDEIKARVRSWLTSTLQPPADRLSPALPEPRRFD